jgi:hypothetical protein
MYKILKNDSHLRHARSKSISRTRRFSMAAQPTAAGFKVLLHGSLRNGQGPATRTSLTLHGGHHRRMLSRMPPHRWRLIRPLSCQLDSPPAFTTQIWFTTTPLQDLRSGRAAQYVDLVAYKGIQQGTHGAISSCSQVCLLKSMLWSYQLAASICIFVYEIYAWCLIT